jgi:hypothetical protein
MVVERRGGSEVQWWCSSVGRRFSVGGGSDKGQGPWHEGEFVIGGRRSSGCSGGPAMGGGAVRWRGCRLRWPAGGVGGAETWRKKPRSCGEEDDEKEESTKREEEEAARGREARREQEKPQMHSITLLRYFTIHITFSLFFILFHQQFR